MNRSCRISSSWVDNLPGKRSAWIKGLRSRCLGRSSYYRKPWRRLVPDGPNTSPRPRSPVRLFSRNAVNSCLGPRAPSKSCFVSRIVYECLRCCLIPLRQDWSQESYAGRWTIVPVTSWFSWLYAELPISESNNSAYTPCLFIIIIPYLHLLVVVVAKLAKKNDIQHTIWYLSG